MMSAFGAFECAPEAFIVAMPPVDPTYREVLVTDKRALAKRRTWLSVGTVIGAGRNTGLSCGDWTLVVPRYAKRVAGIASGPFRYDGEAWMFGISSPHVRTSVVIPSKHTVLAVLGRQEFTFQDRIPADGAFRMPYLPRQVEGLGPRVEGKRVVDLVSRQHGRTAVEGRVLVRLQDKAERRGELHLPDDLHERADVGRVIAASPACSLVSPGDYVVYQRRGMDGLYPEDDRSLAYMPERAIFARCLP